MNKLLVMTTLIILAAFNTNAAVLTETDKVKLAITSASNSLQKDITDFKNQILNDSLSHLSQDSEITHETETVLNEMEKKFPKKSQQEKLALLSAILLSEIGNH